MRKKYIKPPDRNKNRRNFWIDRKEYSKHSGFAGIDMHKKSSGFEGRNTENPQV